MALLIAIASLSHIYAIIIHGDWGPASYASNTAISSSQKKSKLTNPQTFHVENSIRQKSHES